MQSEKVKVREALHGASETLRRMVCSEDLFSGESEIVIKHKSDFYRLMITKAGKLILNK